MNKTEETCIRGCANVSMINRSIGNISKLKDEFDRTANMFSLVSNSTRLKILFLIKNEHRICVCDLSDILEISVSAISQQLRKLKDGGILQSKKEKQTILYYISPGAEAMIAQTFAIFGIQAINKVA